MLLYSLLFFVNGNVGFFFRFIESINMICFILLAGRLLFEICVWKFELL